MVVRVELDGFGEVFNSFWVAMCFKGFIAFILEFEGNLLIAHEKDIISRTLFKDITINFTTKMF